MDSKDFVNWLDGFLAGQTNNLSPAQVQTIKNKLDSVFNKVTPANNPTTTYPNYDTYCGGIKSNYSLIDNGDKPSGVIWSGIIPTPYLGGGFSNYIIC